MSVAQCKGYCNCENRASKWHCFNSCTIPNSTNLLIGKETSKSNRQVSHTSSNLRTIIVDLFSLQKRHRHEWNRPSGKGVGKGYVNGPVAWLVHST